VIRRRVRSFGGAVQPAGERLGDEAANGCYKLIVKKAKDTAAGAVLISAITALVIGIIFLLIPFIEKIIELI
jgi:diacylglycerol kinase